MTLGGRCGALRARMPAALSVLDNGSASVEPDDLTCCLIKLTLLGLPSRTAVELICHGHGCPFASPTFRPTSSKFKLAGALKHSHLSRRPCVAVMTDGSARSCSGTKGREFAEHGGSIPLPLLARAGG